MTIAPWSGWVFEGSGDLPRCWLAIAEWREPASSDRLPVYRSESPTGYSLAGCSPAEPVSASPVADPNNPSLFRRSIKCAARSHGNGADQPAVSLDRTQHRGNADAIGSAAPECHFYFARPVPFLSCADTLTGQCPSTLHSPGSSHTWLHVLLTATNSASIQSTTPNTGQTLPPGPA